MRLGKWSLGAALQSVSSLVLVTVAVSAQAASADTSALFTAASTVVLPFENIGASPPEAIAATDRLMETLLLSRRFAPIDRDETEAVLSEQGLLQSGCPDIECAVRIGRILGTQVALFGKVTRFDDWHWLISVTLVDVELARMRQSQSVLYEGTFFNFLRWSMPELAAQLADPNRTPAPIVRTAPLLQGNSEMGGTQTPEPKNSPSAPNASPATADPPLNKGWALATGTTFRQGTLKTEGGGKFDYTISGGLLLAVGYQAAWRNFSFNTFLADSGGNVEGQMRRYYRTARGVTLGAQLRYLWLSGAYIGGAAGFFNTTFQHSDTVLDSLGMFGTGAGVVGGYEWRNGVFVDGALTQVSFKTLQDTKSQQYPTPNNAFLYGSAEEVQLWLLLGYRWK
jgi:hypothetical protein